MVLTSTTIRLFRENFLEACRSRNRQTYSPPDLGAAAFTTVAMGVESYRKRKYMKWDASKERIVIA